MKRWTLYAIALTLLGLSPQRGLDIGKLSPVETVWLGAQNGQIVIQTDDGNFGRGPDVQKAMQTLRDSSPAVIFLETADYLIVEQGQESLLEQVYAYFRPSCMICTAANTPDLQKATEFLQIHEPQSNLRQWRMERRQLQQLQEQEGRIQWYVDQTSG